MTKALCLAALALLLLYLWHRWQMGRLLRRLDQMLDEAIRGEFREESFNETLLSAVETRLAHYLSASAVSARNLQEERDKIKSLIADISHQTKTPIANVLLYTQLLEEQTPENCRAYTAALGGQARKLQSLIDALVKTSRLEAGVLVMRPRSGSLGPVLEEAVLQFAPKAAEKGLELKLEPAEVEAVSTPSGRRRPCATSLTTPSNIPLPAASPSVPGPMSSLPGWTWRTRDRVSRRRSWKSSFSGFIGGRKPETPRAWAWGSIWSGRSPRVRAAM